MNKLSMVGITVVKHGFQLIVLAYLLLWLFMRPLGVFFLAILTAWIFITQCNLRVLPPPELVSKLEQLKLAMQKMRQSEPRRFCLCSISSLGLLAMLGHYLSDMTVILLGAFLSSLLMFKYRFTIIKVERKVFSLPPKALNETEIDDEFLPDINEQNMCVLERASDFSALSSSHSEYVDEQEEDKSDEIPSELLIPDAIPEIDEVYACDEDDDNIDDLIPIINTNIPNKGDAANYQIPIASPTSIAGVNEATHKIEFKKGHFKRDSSLSTTSSSDEESLSKGLRFPDHTEVDDSRQRELPLPASHANASDLVAMAMKSQSQALLANSTKLIPGLLTGLGRVIAGARSSVTSVQLGEKRVVTALDSSDESDFEILENDDFQ